MDSKVDTASRRQQLALNDTYRVYPMLSILDGVPFFVTDSTLSLEGINALCT